MRFSAPLIPARFLERRQRFLARVELPDQRRVWVHVASAFPLAHHYRAVLAWGP